MTKLLIMTEFKNFTVTGPLVDQIVGSSMRAQDIFAPAQTSSIFIFCRGYTSDAEQRRKHYAKHRNLKIVFKVVED